MARLAEAAFHGGHKVTYLVVGKSLLSEVKNKASIWGIARLFCRSSTEIEEIGIDTGGSLTETIDFKVIPVLPKGFPRVLRRYVARRYQKVSALLTRYVVGSELVIVESGYALFYAGELMRQLPSARFVYRMSDDIELFFKSPELHEEEEKISGNFHLISIPSHRLAAKKALGGSNVTVQPHGVPRSIVGVVKEPSRGSKEKKKNIAVLGGTLGDQWVINAIAARGDCLLHVFSKLKPNMSRNVRYYGEVELEEAVPTLRECDIGLCHYKKIAGSEYLAETSNKTLIYTVLGLAIVLPEHANPGWGNCFPYIVGDLDSLNEALNRACRFKPSHSVLRASISEWGDVLADIICKSGVHPFESQQAKK